MPLHKGLISSDICVLDDLLALILILNAFIFAPLIQHVQSITMLLE
jgi:hypothetical protein